MFEAISKEEKKRRKAVAALLTRIRRGCGIMYRAIDADISEYVNVTQKIATLGKYPMYHRAVFEAIYKRGEVLSTVKVESTEEVSQAIERAGISVSSVARRIGISPAGLTDRILKATHKESTLREMEMVLQQIGVDLMNCALGGIAISDNLDNPKTGRMFLTGNDSR